jgi:hypothetical protein
VTIFDSEIDSAIDLSEDIDVIWKKCKRTLSALSGLLAEISETFEKISQRL